MIRVAYINAGFQSVVIRRKVCNSQHKMNALAFYGPFFSINLTICIMLGKILSNKQMERQKTKQRKQPMESVKTLINPGKHTGEQKRIYIKYRYSEMETKPWWIVEEGKWDKETKTSSFSGGQEERVK